MQERMAIENTGRRTNSMAPSDSGDPTQSKGVNLSIQTRPDNGTDDVESLDEGNMGGDA